MEIPVSAPVVEREGRRVNSSSGFRRHHKILFGVVISIGILLYAGFNLWVYRYSKSGKAPSPATLWQTVTEKSESFEVLKGDSLPFEAQGKPQGDTLSNSSPAPTPTPLPTPTPTPRLTGPGEYACDPYGVCNRYGDAARKEFCPVTFADSLCLDQCGDKEKQCKQ